MIVSKDTPAGAQDHRAVPLDKGLEGQLGSLVTTERIGHALQAAPGDAFISCTSLKTSIAVEPDSVTPRPTFLPRILQNGSKNDAR
jgi:hypothetical protein